MANEQDVSNKNKQKASLNFNINYKILTIILALLLIVSVAMWKPWVRDAENRTVTVTGEAVITAEADEFIFYPNWKVTAPTEQEALAQVTVKSDEIVTKLKELGVPDQNIKVTSSGNDGVTMYYPTNEVESDPTYYLNINITATSKDQAQKVQNYLITTAPIGVITPSGGFSDAKQNELESQARDEASKDAREKADQTAKNLGFKVGKVKLVSDLQQGYIYPMYALDASINSAEAGTTKTTDMAIQPGTNDLNYTITVEYYIR